jgi:hypothetical protein
MRAEGVELMVMKRQQWEDAKATLGLLVFIFAVAALLYLSNG